VVSRAELAGLGASPARIDGWVKRDRLHRLYRGVYAVGHSHLGREGRRLAAVLACGEGAALSHRSAASHWGLLDTQSAFIDVTARRSREGVRGIRLHTARSLAPQDTTTHEGIPITSVARTLLDLAATVRPDRLERALAQAERLQLYDYTAISDVLSRSNGHRGRAALTRATAQEPKLTRNDLEAIFLALVRQAGLPEPQTNLPSPPSTTYARTLTSTGRRTG
jgi:predicted transcriptional regulator of viral defense system